MCETSFNQVQAPHDRAIFMLMLRYGLRVEEVANLTLGFIDVRSSVILEEDGKGEMVGPLYQYKSGHLICELLFEQR